MHRATRTLFLAISILLSAFPVFAIDMGQVHFAVAVSAADQKTYVYRNGQLLRVMTCSTGKLDGDNDTPIGEFFINESGNNLGTWFFSSAYQEGAKYWVGFIGGKYLFHSVPMDKGGCIIEKEAAKLGTPASHGCIRLGLDDAHWFYETIPPGTPLEIVAEPRATKAFATTGLAQAASVTKSEVPSWLARHSTEYKQAYTLSCEIALIRLSLGLAGVSATEDEILSTIPRSSDNPEKAFVCDDIRGGRRNKDGSIHWNNYGTHPPVVVAQIERRLTAAGAGDRIEAREFAADDGTLRSLAEKDPAFLGAIVWLVGHPERWGEHPPVNERGMVLGEHVRFLEPALTPDGRFRIWDPETGKLLVAKDAGAGRESFGYRTVCLFRRGR